MKQVFVRCASALAAALVLTLAGCGGGGGGTAPPPETAPPVPLQQALSQAAALPTNDTSVNASAPFTVLQNAGYPAVTISSVPNGTRSVNFTVFSDGAIKQGLTLSNMTFAIAKLVPGSNGDPDRWTNYIYRKETATPGVGPGGTPVLATAMQATTDPAAAAKLVYNPDGYYTYTFGTAINDPNATNGVVFEPGRTHRIAIQLNYTNAAGQKVLVNPYFDFTIDGNSNSVAVTDPAATRKMTDVTSCNGCHNKLALHGGGRVDTQFCVMCHNPGTTDANSGNVLTFATMVHKIHSGRELAEAGEHYTIWGFNNSKNDYSEVGFPQPTRNCVKCHDGSNPLTPQGNNWKTTPSKEACLSCHQSGPTSAWATTHVSTLKLGTSAATIPNSACASCHSATSPFNAEKVHWVQEMANAALYQGKIESVSLKNAPTATAAGTLTVVYSVVDPASGTAYDLREGCSQAATKDSGGTAIVGCNTNYRWDAVVAPTPVGQPQDKFGTFALNVGANTLPQTTDDATIGTTGYPAYMGIDNGSHHYTAYITLPAGSHGNVRVLMTGSVAERRLSPVTRAPVGASPPIANADLAYVPVKNALYEFDVDTRQKASATARRQIVSNDNCNSCHGILGLPTSADPNVPAFHKGVRNNSEACAVCHNANQSGSYTLMTDGSQVADGTSGTIPADSQMATNTSSFLHESYQAKRFIHGIHGRDKRTYPFTHCMNVGGEYNKDGTSKTVAGLVLGAATCLNQYPLVTDNFTAEVAFPGHLSNCENCHVTDSWKRDRSVLGSVVFKPTGATGMLDSFVISPKAATCTSCHDSKTVQTHVTTVGATFGKKTQNDLLNKGLVFESCEGCHASGSAIGVDVVHKK